MESAEVWCFIISFCVSLTSFWFISKLKVHKKFKILFVFLLILLIIILPNILISCIVHPMPEYGKTIPIHMGRSGYQSYSPNSIGTYDEEYSKESEWRKGVMSASYFAWYIAFLCVVILLAVLQFSFKSRKGKDSLQLFKDKKHILLGIVFFVVGLVLHLLTFVVGDFYLFLFSILLMSIGCFCILSHVNMKIAYFLLGLINGISAPLYVHLSILIFNYNSVSRLAIVLSVLFGLIGIFIGIIGICIQIKSIKLKENVFVFKALIASQIVTWAFSFLFALFAPLHSVP